MNVRDLKLAIVCGVETEEIKSLNIFFDNLFSNMKIYINDDNQNLIFVIYGKCLMYQDVKDGSLYCRFVYLWSNLTNVHKCTVEEIQEIIQHKIYQFFEIETFTPCLKYSDAMRLYDRELENDNLTLITKRCIF